MANLKQLVAALKRKQAELDEIDDQLSEMPEMAPGAPEDGETSPEFDLLSDKREELEQEIAQKQEGVQLLTEWEKFKEGPWSEDIKDQLNSIDTDVTEIAGGEEAPAGDMLGGPEAPDMEAPAPEAAPAPEMEAEPQAPEAPAPVEPAAEEPLPEPAPAEEPAPLPEEPAAPVSAPVASKKSPVSKKNSYQAPDKKGNSSPSSLKKEGSNMATQTQSKPSLKEKLAEVKSRREAIKREAQQRVAAAWTIAKTMLPDAPPEVQKTAAATFLQNPTPVLNAMLRQTAKNAHYSKVAETFKQVHKVEMNDLLEDPSILHSEKASVESEIKGDPKNAAAKKADDRKDAGPQTPVYDDGRCYPSKDTTPAEMHADSPKSQTEAENRPMDTINKSEGDKAGKEASAKKPAAAKKEAAEAKTACPSCAKKMSSGEQCEACAKAAAEGKTADESAVAEPPAEEAAELGEAQKAEEELGEAQAEEAAEPPAEDNAAEVLSDEKKMVVEEKIEEAQEAISALEKEILEEEAEGEELDFNQVFDEQAMDDKVSSLANEGDEHVAGNGEEFFAPSAAESLEASLEDTPQLASMEDFFSLQGSDSDPLARLIAGEVRTAAEVAGMEVVPSFTGEAAKHFESNTATGESRDDVSDHEGDLFAEAIEQQQAEDGGFKRVKQDDTNVLEAPKSATKKKTASAAAPAKEKTATEAAPVIKKLKPVVASEQKPLDIAAALLGNDDEF